MAVLKCKCAKQNRIQVRAELKVSSKTNKKIISIVTVDKTGVPYPLEDYTSSQIMKGNAVKDIAEVLPILLMKQGAEDRENLQNQLEQMLLETPNKKDGWACNFKDVHAEVCEWVRNSQRKDYRTINETQCTIRKAELKMILEDILDTGWTTKEFVKTLDNYGMLEAGNDRLEKKVTDSSGKGGQYRAYVFSVNFKEVERTK